MSSRHRIHVAFGHRTALCKAPLHLNRPLNGASQYSHTHYLRAHASLATFAHRPNLELELGAEGDALEIQYERRFRSDAQSPPAREDRPPMAHYHSPEDLIVHLERCLPSRRESREDQ